MPDPQAILWLISFLVGGFAAWMDWRKHEVPNAVWIFGLLLALPFLAIEVFKEPLDALIRWLCFAGFFLFTYAMWRTGTFGAADAKGLSFFSLVLSPVGYYDLWHAKIYPALDVMVTAIVVAWILEKLLKRSKLPFYTVVLGPLLLVRSAGGLIWWPLVALLGLFVH